MCVLFSRAVTKRFPGNTPASQLQIHYLRTDSLSSPLSDQKAAADIAASFQVSEIQRAEYQALAVTLLCSLGRFVLTCESAFCLLRPSFFVIQALKFAVCSADTSGKRISQHLPHFSSCIHAHHVAGTPVAVAAHLHLPKFLTHPRAVCSSHMS